MYIRDTLDISPILPCIQVRERDNIKILFDFDDVLNDLSKCWIRELNRRYHCEVTYDQIAEFDIRKAYPDLTEKQIYLPYLDGTLYVNISAVKQAQELIHTLAGQHEFYISTANLLGIQRSTLSDFFWEGCNSRAVQYMLQFLWDYYPEIPWDHIIVSPHKELIRGDVLIDDNPTYLTTFRGTRILLDKPYNRSFDTERHNIVRAADWNDVKRAIEDAAESLIYR